MSSLVERLRARSDKRPQYALEESDDDDFVAGMASSKGKQAADEPPEKFVRDDAKEDTCQSCGADGTLVSCSTCTYAFHKKCLYPCAKAAIISDKWSCPECVTPLTEIEKILDCETRPVPMEDNEPLKSSPKRAKYYLVKWKGLSYLHCTWVPEKEFLKASKSYPRLKSRLNNFRKQMELNKNAEDDCVAIRPEWTTVDRIIASRKNSDEREYLVKWRELPYDECTWEVDSDISAFKPQIERYNMIQSRGSEKSSAKIKNAKRDAKESKVKPKEFQHYDHSPEFLSGGKLHPYQLEGLNFLRYSWSKSTHVILADEMGLGKTIQSIAFLASLFEEKLSPHLVVAPLSTLRNWEREFATWAPQLNVVMYFGSSQARDVIKKYEFYFPKPKASKKKSKKSSQNDKLKKKPRIKFDVLLTSYEMINMDSGVLKPIQWECMIVDEGHRLKNKDSKLFNQLKLYSTKHRVLLTGTPLQNNLDELFMLMHFLDAGKFASIEDFQKEFTDINQEEQIARLHKMLAPHLLRRVKKDVMKDLPPKKELILRVELSNIQKEYYKAILTRNYQILARRGGAQISLINVVMELRKLCCHAYMLEGVEPTIEPKNADDGLRQFLDASGKMHLLDKMMVKLKKDGHRVLIYSQFQHMLDLLEDYLSYKKWTYERIDGKVSGAERQIRIDRFNAKNSTRFCFLLSTRAGGLGINLATADTVIIYDSDWNPHADLQAMARAHRLGQTNKVLIYRLITRGTIEERMMQMTKKKMILEHLVVGKLKAQTVNQEELDDIIRYGSKELFADESEEAKARQIHYDDAAIDRLLNRDHIDGEEASVDEEDDDLLKAFKVANFEYIDEAEADAVEEDEVRKQSTVDKASTSNAERANYWDDLLKDRYEVQKVEEFNAMGKGKRSRKQMATAEDDNLEASSEDDDYSFEGDSSENEGSNAGNMSSRKGSLSRKRTRDTPESHPLMEGEGRSLKVLGFNQHQRALFQQLIMRFGFQDYTWKKEYLPRLKGKSLQEIHNYGRLFMEHIREDVTDSPTFSDGVPKEARIDDVMVRIANIQLIEEKVEFMSKKPGSNILPEDISRQFPGLGNGRVWKREHDLLLLNAILKHGYARWQYIVEDDEVGIAELARRELNLPSGLFPESTQRNESAISDHQNNGKSEVGKESEMQQGFNSSQSRELQRRVVEFIRKRYFLLEKALNLEYAKSILGQNEPTSHDAPTGTSVPPVTNNSSSVNELLKQLPDLQQIFPGEPNFDNKNERLEIARLYNEMCRVVEENACDSAYTFLGDSSAASRLRTNMYQLETINKDVHRILHVRDESECVDLPSGSLDPSSRDQEMLETVKVPQECPPSSRVDTQNGNQGECPSSSRVDTQNGNQGQSSASVGTSEQGPEAERADGSVRHAEQHKGCEDRTNACDKQS